MFLRTLNLSFATALVLQITEASSQKTTWAYALFQEFEEQTAWTFKISHRLKGLAEGTLGVELSRTWFPSNENLR